MPEFYSGATGLSGRFTEGFSLRRLQFYLVRRFVCQLTPKNYNRFFLSILKRIKKSFQ